MDLALILTAVGVGIATMAVSITAISIMFGMYRQITQQTGAINTKLAELDQKIEGVKSTVTENSEKINDLIASSDNFNERFGEMSARTGTLEGSVTVNSQNIGILRSEISNNRDHIRRTIDLLQSNR